MGICASAYEASGDAGLSDLTGVQFQHDLHLIVRDWAAWSAISDQIIRQGGDIHALQVTRGAGAYAVRCRLEGVEANAVRRLTAALLDTGAAEHAAVEHLLLAKRYVGSAR